MRQVMMMTISSEQICANQLRPAGRPTENNSGGGGGSSNNNNSPMSCCATNGGILFHLLASGRSLSPDFQLGPWASPWRLRRRHLLTRRWPAALSWRRVR